MLRFQDTRSPATRLLIASAGFAFCLALGTVGWCAEPDAAELIDQARQAAVAGKLDDAVGLASSAIKAAPDNRDAYYLRARLNSLQENYAAAAKDYGRVIELDPKDRLSTTCAAASISSMARSRSRLPTLTSPLP